MNDIENAIQSYRAEQSKYTYYIVALCVTGIGFSASQTMGRQLELSMWPLGIAILFFGLSIYSGLKFIRFIITGIALDIEIKQISSDRSEQLRKALSELNLPYGESAKHHAISGIMEAVSAKQRSSSRWLSYQNISFYLAVFSFVAWRVWEMYLLSLPN